MKRILVVVVALMSVPALAASPSACDGFLKAFEKAGKAVGKPPGAADLTFWKTQCLKDKEKDEAINKQAKCLDSVKAESDLKTCFR